MPKLGLSILLFLLVTSLSAAVSADQRLRSLALHNELGQDVFIGALYSEPSATIADPAAAANMPMRLELKMVSPDGFSGRRFSRLWIEGIAINQSASQLEAQARNVISFDQLFTMRLIQNDHIVIANLPNQGVEISLNGSSLGKIADNQFFSLLLSTWIGRVPLSSAFRTSILDLQQLDASLDAQFRNMQPSAQRRQKIAQWVAGRDQPEPPLNASSSASAPNTPIAAELAQSNVIDKPVISKPVLDRPAPAPVAAAPALSQPSAASSQAADIEDEPSDEQSVLTAQTLLARQYYLNDVITKIHQQIRYPDRALKRRQEGNIRLKITLDRHGNLLNVIFIETSEHLLLNKEATRAINQATPFPQVPEAIAGQTVDLTIPLRFALPR